MRLDVIILEPACLKRCVLFGRISGTPRNRRGIQPMCNLAYVGRNDRQAAIATRVSITRKNSSLDRCLDSSIGVALGFWNKLAITFRFPENNVFAHVRPCIVQPFPGDWTVRVFELGGSGVEIPFDMRIRRINKGTDCCMHFRDRLFDESSHVDRLLIKVFTLR